LALLYSKQGRYGDAEPLYQRSLAIWEKALGRDHPYVALSLNNLAGLYRSQGRYADALPIIRRTLSQGTATKTVAFPVLFASQVQDLARTRGKKRAQTPHATLGQLFDVGIHHAPERIATIEKHLRFANKLAA
jgi:tetratricopeptide (TPR) repeat protein